jgi:hypothetical protein
MPIHLLLTPPSTQMAVGANHQLILPLQQVQQSPSRMVPTANVVNPEAHSGDGTDLQPATHLLCLLIPE